MKRGLFTITLAVSLLIVTFGSIVQALPNLQAAPVSVTVAEAANLRAGPGVSFARVGSAAAGSTLQVVGCNADCTWYKTAAGTWIAAELLVVPPVSLPNVDGAAPSMAAPASSTSSFRLPTPTPIGQAATVDSATQTVTATPVQISGPVANSVANLRSGPGTEFERLGNVQQGAALELTGQTANGDWLQLADGSWIAAFLVDNVAAGLPVIANLPTPVPAQLGVTPPAAAAEQTPEPSVAQPSGAAASVTSPHDLVVEFINPHYNCEQGEYQFEETVGIVEKIWAYRSFQVDMYITNNGADPIEPTWAPTRWIITDGLNEMVNDQMWQWISRYSGKYEQPTIFPGQKAGWTWIAMPVGRYEWVKAVEFEYDGQLYRQEFDLGPYGNAYNYINCGERARIQTIRRPHLSHQPATD